MLYREIIAVCYQIHTKHINTVCGQNVELLNVKLVVHIATIGLQRVKTKYSALKLWRYQQMQNSTTYVLFPSLRCYIFRRCRHPQVTSN